MFPRTWTDWVALGWLAACALGVLVSIAASGQSYPVWRTAGFTSAGMVLLGGPLALFCFTALPAAGLLIAGELLGLP